MAPMGEGLNLCFSSYHSSHLDPHLLGPLSSLGQPSCLGHQSYLDHPSSLAHPSSLGHLSYLDPPFHLDHPSDHSPLCAIPALCDSE